MNDIVQEVIRRAILDLLNDIGGEQNDDVLSSLLGRLGHRIARRDVRAALDWLAARDLIRVEQLSVYTVARIIADGRDVADGKLRIEGISRHKTGE